MSLTSGVKFSPSDLLEVCLISRQDFYNVFASSRIVLLRLFSAARSLWAPFNDFCEISASFVRVIPSQLHFFEFILQPVSGQFSTVLGLARKFTISMQASVYKGLYFLEIAFVAFQVSQPYNRTGLALQVKTMNFSFIEVNS